MNRKKKIITIVGTLIFIALLAGFIWFMFYTPDINEVEDNKISIELPQVDQKKIQQNSKLEKYQQDNNKDKIEKGLAGSINFRDVNPNFLPDDSTAIPSGGNRFESRLEQLSDLNGRNRDVLATKPGQDQMMEDQITSEMRELMAMQHQLMSQNEPEGPYDDTGEIESLLKQYDQAMATTTGLGKYNRGHDTISQPLQDRLETKMVETLSLSKEKLNVKDYFQGAGDIVGKDNIRDLIPIETVDEGILVNGSTIALRTKSEMVLRNPAVRIPKGAIVYGKVTISTDRLLIDIHAYKEGLKLHMLDFSVYDFDGREGIHLGNRTWPKIPSKVAKDVYEYAYQKGSQTNSFVGDSDVDLDQAKDIAILSAAKHVGNEIFDKRRVYMPKKYHLWFNIRSN